MCVESTVPALSLSVCLSEITRLCETRISNSTVEGRKKDNMPTFDYMQ